MSGKGKSKARIFIVVAVALVAAVSLIAPLQAGSLRDSAGEGSDPAAVTGQEPGEVLWGYYNTTLPGADDSAGNGDNLLHLVNPHGNANSSFGAINNVCAMIYVFDNDQEMGECCGCPLSPADLQKFSVINDLTSNFILGGNPTGHEVGALAVVAADPNVANVAGGSSNGQGCPAAQSSACNSGCDPTSNPGFAINSDNLLGSIIQNQTVGADGGARSGLTEVPLYNDGGGDAANLTYLQNECGALVVQGSGAGFCHCPVLPTATPTATATPTQTATSTPTPTETSTPTETAPPTPTATETSRQTPTSTPPQTA